MPDFYAVLWIIPPRNMCKVCVTVYSIVALGQIFLPNVIFFQNSDYDDLEKSIMLGLESKLSLACGWVGLLSSKLHGLSSCAM